MQARMSSATTSTEDVNALLRKRAKAHAAAFELLARDPTSFASADSGCVFVRVRV
jgi:hypothetical protein